MVQLLDLRFLCSLEFLKKYGNLQTTSSVLNVDKVDIDKDRVGKSRRKAGLSLSISCWCNLPTEEEVITGLILAGRSLSKGKQMVGGAVTSWFVHLTPE